MSDTKHTPGPWEPRQNESGMYVTCVNEQHVDSDGDPSDICSIENEGYFGAEQAWANVRLIAAAPELLEALQGMYADQVDYLTINKLGGMDNHWMIAARKAIAKATGAA